MVRGALNRLVLGAAIVLAASGIMPGASGAQTVPKTTLADMTGPDDGFGLSIQCSGDFAGKFQPCGCKVPLGGFPRRAGYAKAVEALTGGKAAVLQLDAGRIFAGEAANGFAAPGDIAVQNEWVLRAAEELNLAAANVSAYDLAFLSKLMEANGYEARLTAHPVLGRFVSANVVPASARQRAFAPYLVTEVKSERFGAKPLRIGLLGVTEVPKSGATVSGYTITDPYAAIKKYAPEVRAKCDLFVILAYLDKKALAGVEPAAGGVDGIVVAHQFPPSTFDGVAQFPVYAFAVNETKAVVEVRLYPAPPNQPQRVSRLALRYVLMNGLVPDDPAAATLMNDALRAYRKF